MEFASKVKEKATAVRHERMKVFADGPLTDAILKAQEDGLEFAKGDVPIDVDLQMLKRYVSLYGYDITVDVNGSVRTATVCWTNPSK